MEVDTALSSNNANAGESYSKQVDQLSSIDITHIHKSLFAANESIDDIEDEVELYAGLAGPSTSLDSNGAMAGTSLVQASKDYLDSLQAIVANPWEQGAWLTFLEEVEAGRGGAATPEEAYIRFLERFPLAFKVWRRLAAVYRDRQDFKQTEATYAKCLDQCRSVNLWLDWLLMLKSTGLDKVNKIDEKQYALARQAFESALERAVTSSVGAIDATPLWRLYADFVREYPEPGTADPGRRLQTQRKVYQRAVCIPLSDADSLWREYEALERGAGEILADRVLPEYRERNQHARALFRERQRLTNMIAADRLAIPPTTTSFESQQLDMWDQYIRFECTNPDNLQADGLRALLECAYRRCLCCFRLHPEVWLSFARVEAALLGRPGEARSVLLQAVEALPTVAGLRIALAELEEQYGAGSGLGHAIEGARGVYREAFETLPSAYTFAAYQRFVRRVDGIAAGRRLFSDTWKLRQDKKLGVEVFMAHAQLEWEVNCSPAVAAQVMRLALTADPTALGNESFIRLFVRVLTAAGDVKQLRWLCQSALGITGTLSGNGTASIGVGNGAGLNSVVSNVEAAGRAEYKVIVAPLTNPGSRSRILGDLLRAEVLLCQSDMCRLDQLRRLRDEAHSAASGGLSRRGVSGSSSSGVGTVVGGLFDAARDLYERHSHGLHLAEGYSSLQHAISGDPDRAAAARVLVTSSAATSFGLSNNYSLGYDLHQDGLALDQQPGSGPAVSARQQDSTNERDLAEAGLPLSVRDLLTRLPMMMISATPDPRLLTMHLRGLILPPRPAERESNVSLDGLSTDPTSKKRGSGMDSWEGDESGFERDVAVSTREDVFRQRRREGLGLA